MRTRVVPVLAVLAGVVAGCDQKMPPPVPDTVAVTLSPADVSADSASLTASALVTERRVALEKINVTFHAVLTASSGASPTIADITSLTDVNGLATADFSGLQKAGLGKITVTAYKADKTTAYQDATGAPIAGSAEFRVHPGAPASLASSLNPTSINPAQNPAATYADVSWQVRDAKGNLTADSVIIATDAPGAVVLASRVDNLTAAGTWSVTTSVAGHPEIFNTEPVQVLPGSAKIINTFLSNATTDAYADPLAHPPVVVSYKVTDGSGNDVTAASVAEVACSIGAASGASLNATTGVLSNLVIKGTFPVKCALSAGMTVIASNTQTLTVVDLTPPVVGITAPANGTHVGTGAAFTVTVSGSDLVGVSSLSAQLVGLLENITQSQLIASNANKTASASFTFTAAATGNFGGTQTIFALGADGSGNSATAAPVSIVVDPFQPMPAGISANLVLQTALIGTPTAIAQDPQSLAATPVLDVADQAGIGRIWRVTYNRAAGTATTALVTSGHPFAGLEWNAAGDRLYASAGNQIFVYDRTGAEITAERITVAGGAGLAGLAFGPGGSLYACDNAAAIVWKITVGATPASAPFLTAGTARTNGGGGTNLNQPTGIAYDPVTDHLFVSDFGRNLVYESTNAGVLSVFMQNGLGFPRPDFTAINFAGMDYKGLGGPYPNQLFVANNGANDILNALRDVNPLDGFSDAWGVFLGSPAGVPVDMAFKGNRLYVLFAAGGPMSAHVVELSGF